MSAIKMWLLLLVSSLVAVAALAQNPSSQTSVTCGTTSGTFLTAIPAISYLTIQVPTGSNTVCFNFAGAAATTAPPSLCYSPGSTVTWYNVRDQLVPNGASTCIATPGSQAVAVMYR